MTPGLASSAKRNKISAHQQAANAFSCSELLSSKQENKVKLQPKLLKLRGHNHQDNTTTKDKFTITKGIKADTVGTTETPHTPDLES